MRKLVKTSKQLEAKEETLRVSHYRSLHESGIAVEVRKSGATQEPSAPGLASPSHSASLAGQVADLFTDVVRHLIVRFKPPSFALTSPMQIHLLQIYQEHAVCRAAFKHKLVSAAKSIPIWEVIERGTENFVNSVPSSVEYNINEKKGMTLEDLLMKVGSKPNRTCNRTDQGCESQSKGSVATPSSSVSCKSIALPVIASKHTGRFRKP